MPVKVCESQFQQLFQNAPLLSLHARFAFEALGKIGEGGMGEVYQVKDRRFDRVAALKLLSDKNAKDHARLGFLREAKITAKLDHPAIPPVHEIGLTADGDLYMLMRMIRGRTLSECVKECHELGTMERRDLVEIMVKVSEAVAYAHSRGIIHRDLKPDNIMVGEFGEVLVIDWGIAKDLNTKETEQSDQILECVISKSELEQVGVTVSGTMVGTPGYMAPEQIDGVEIDHRADVFAMGVILVEVLTGMRAIVGGTLIELATKTVSGYAKSPREYNSLLSKEIDWIARRALALELEDRTQSAEDLVAQLRAYLNRDEIPGYSYSLIERVQRTIKRRPGFIVSATVGALLFALIGNLWLTLELEGQKREKAEDAVIVAEKRLGTAEDEAEKAKAVLALFNEARNLVERGAPQAKLKEKIAEALKRGGRTESQLLTAVRIYSGAYFDDVRKELLEEAVELYPPCYEGLFLLHLRELKLSTREFYFTSYLRTLLAESKRRGEVNEFTLFADAVQLSSSGRLDESIATYSKIEKYSINFSWMYNNRGNSWERKGELDKALDDYNRAIELNPKYVVALTNRGGIWKVKGYFDRALADYNRAIELNPRDSRTFFNRGVLWEKSEDHDKALADFSRAIELNRRFAMAFNNRGLIWENKGDLEKALADYSKAIELDPRENFAFTNRGGVWKEIGEFDKALADYKRAIEINPNEAHTFLRRGVVWEAKGELDKALADYNKTLKLDPRNTGAWNNRGIIWEKKGQLNKALADYARGIEVEPQSVDILMNRGRVFFKKGESDKALADYNRVIKLNSRSALAFNNRGFIWRTKGALDKALADFNKAIEIDPGDPRAIFNRGKLWSSKSQYAKAIVDVNRAIALNCKDPYAFFVRGYLNFSLKKSKDAVKDLETFLRTAPNHRKAANARQLLAQIRAEQGQ